ncbi:glycosyltransferase family 2 protein [Halobacillus sp. Marseille-Q1614]|uniref:glycosyltransferase family 2 protein n=1 Tax=Halobacillus sp. Marseille-Q1614 TaxID=2709134 RepID=UPI00156DC568|nr:glycosyltransferase family 2 protein [Halobacillus sp. Marseille-Q1614]
MGTAKPVISVVVPIYGCRSCLRELCNRVRATIADIPADYEILLVNDSSPDHAWKTITELAGEDPLIRGIDLARNFGQHYAITAGLDHTTGDWVVVMDCDLQDRPEEIAALFQKAQEGYEVVFAKRVVRRDSWLKRMSSKAFYRVYDYFTGHVSDHTVANFSIAHKKVIKGFRQMREQSRLYPLFLQWMGYKTASIVVEHKERGEGKSSYNLKKLITLATDTIIAQSNKPLRLSIQIGFFISLGSFLYGMYLFLRYFFMDEHVQGWTSVMVSMYFIAGLMFFNFGIIGLYIGKVFNEAKGRPLYLIREQINEKEAAKDRR